jgi:hypothetical protein
MKKLISGNLMVLLLVAGTLITSAFLLKYVILFIGVMLISLIGFLMYELLG